MIPIDVVDIKILLEFLIWEYKKICLREKFKMIVPFNILNSSKIRCICKNYFWWRTVSLKYENNETLEKFQCLVLLKKFFFRINVQRDLGIFNNFLKIFKEFVLCLKIFRIIESHKIISENSSRVS